MRLHRFYLDPEVHKLEQKMWLREPGLLNQWQRVLRYQQGQQVILFDAVEHESLYKIIEFKDGAVHLERVTDMVRSLPKKDIYLAWALLKKDKNDWVLQKCTELGVNHFVPILSERCEKTGFNEERARKIIIEATEQCGRSNIPGLREPMQLETLLDEFVGKVPVLVCDELGAQTEAAYSKVLLVVGPEGGWSDSERELFKAQNVELITIGDFTLRAETAVVTTVVKQFG